MTTIPDHLIELAAQLLEWGCGKLTDGDGFSVLMLSQHPDGLRATNYCLASVEEALARAEEELRDGAGVQAYVLAYDVTMKLAAGPRRGFLFELEEAQAEAAIALFHGTKPDAAGRWQPDGEFIFAWSSEKRLPAPASAPDQPPCAR